MRRVLLVQPSMQPPGGGNGVAAWMLQALVAAHRVTVLSWRPVDVDPINRFFGTSLRPSDFDTMGVPRSWTWGPDHLPVPAALLRSALLMRYTRRVSDPFDVIIGAHNETDYGRRGIQYVHYPTYLRPRPEVDYRWYHRASPALLAAYYRVTDRIAGFSFERLRQNLTLANSNWTARRIEQLLGVTARTVYPPVVDPLDRPAWSERRNAFLAVGRISPEKEYERSMRILARVRERAPDLTFTIVGTWDRHLSRYMRELRRLAASLGSWVEFRQDVSRDDVRRLMASYRYGIHGMREEHFGMAPAEMARAGMIVWVPRGGGQVEIVGDEPALLYDTEEEGVEKILAVVQAAAEQARVREYLHARAMLFGTDRFIDEVRSIVSAFRE
jgi:glycosyltransferase involved in cell wall biosynthesis